MTISGSNATPASWIFHGSKVDKFHQVPHAREEDALCDALLEICRTQKITHIIALTDLEVDLLCLHRHAFEELGVTACIPSAAAISICRDKWLMHQNFLASQTIQVIPSYLGDDIALHQLPFPQIAKPRKGRSSDGLVKLGSPADLAHFQSQETAAACIVQPQLHGAVHVVDLVRQQSTGKVATTTRVELMRTANGAGVTVQMTDNPILKKTATEVAEKLQINGCINLEFIQHGGAFFLMDINPRFSAGIAFSKIHGYDMVKNHLRCHLTPETDIDFSITGCPNQIITRHYTETASS